MRPGIHPAYGPVVFRDRAAGHAFLTRSTATSDKAIEWEDGRTYPVIYVETSSASHPFYTGSARVVDTAGRVERFNAGTVAAPDRHNLPAAAGRRPRVRAGQGHGPVSRGLVQRRLRKRGRAVLAGAQAVEDQRQASAPLLGGNRRGVGPGGVHHDVREQETGTLHVRTQVAVVPGPPDQRVHGGGRACGACGPRTRPRGSY